MNIEKQRNLRKQVSVYGKANTKSSIWQLSNTLIPFFLLWYLAYQSLSISYLITFVLSIINAGFLVRMFIIFHDCCHYSFFKKKIHNQVTGTITGILTLFPYSQWQHSHAIHHATSGNLDKRGVGDIWVMTVKEYTDANFFSRMKYRLYRNPFVLFIIGPIYAFLIQQRFNKKDARGKERFNTYLTNFSIVAIVSFLCFLIGWKSFILVHAPIFLLSGSLGIWLFYIQHQFEDTYFEWDDEWEYVKAAVEGSSFYKLPKILQWVTGNIGYHHVHHLSPKIPNYLLEPAHENSEALKNVPTVTLKTSIASIKFRLWDDENNKFISYKEAKKNSFK